MVGPESREVGVLRPAGRGPIAVLLPRVSVVTTKRPLRVDSEHAAAEVVLPATNGRATDRVAADRSEGPDTAVTDEDDERLERTERG